MKKRSNAHLQRRQQRKARHTARRQAKRRSTGGSTPNRGEAMVYELQKTIQHFFPDLFEQWRQLEDCRRKSDYALSEILMAGIALFLFQQGSRHAFNNQRQEAQFRKHYQQLFKRRLLHLDTVHRVLCRLSEDQLECFCPPAANRRARHPHRYGGGARRLATWWNASRYRQDKSQECYPRHPES